MVRPPSPTVPVLVRTKSIAQIRHMARCARRAHRTRIHREDSGVFRFYLTIRVPTRRSPYRYQLTTKNRRTGFTVWSNVDGFVMA